MTLKNIARTVVVITLNVCCAAALGQVTNSQFRAPGWGELVYQPPAAGTYELPPIMSAVNGEVITSKNVPVQLFDLMQDRIVFLSFIFTRCSDINGCPLANAVLYKVQSRLNKQPELARNVALLSISFDPEYDTPEVTHAMKYALSDGSVNWEWLTTRGQDALQPILDGYGQFAVRMHDEHGNQVDDYAHMLRVYLIDTARQIRNIYSVSFLHPDILMNDLQTLLLENQND